PPTPLPRGQMFVFCCARIGEPIAFTVLFPFMYFVTDLNVTDDPRRLGIFVGLLAASYSISQFLSSLPWGALSDRIGRRPVILSGLCGTTLSLLMLGLSKSYLWAIAARIMAGLLNGNSGVMMSLLGEISDHSNRARAFSIMPALYGVGSTIGPIIGGMLSNPATQFPRLFGDSVFLRRFPYFLPCATCAAITGFGFLISCLFLKETLTIADADSFVNADEERHSSPSAASAASKGYWLIPQQCWPPVLAGASYAFLMVIYNEIFPIWAATPIARHGLGFQAHQIGIALGFTGVFSFVALLFFVPAERRLGPQGLYRTALLVYTPICLLFPFFSNLMASDGVSMPMFWGLLIVALAWRAVSALLAYSAYTVMVLDSARGTDMLGVVNGVAMCAQALSQAVGPPIGGLVWSWSQQTELV
ncbi:major facilitator superfamily domain-containing protein, partial [Thamnocephalis sphaerospora]